MKNYSKTYLFILFAFTAFVLSCGTIRSLKLADPDNIKGPISARELAFRDLHNECEKPSEFLKIPYVYSGTKTDLLFLARPYHCGWDTGEVSVINNAIFILMTPFIIIDVPLSFIADTVMLPITIPKQYKEGNIIDPPYFKIGDVYQGHDDEKAIEYYKKGLKILPKYYGNRSYYEIYPYLSDIDDIFYWSANYYDKRGEYDKAIFYYERLLELDLRYSQGPSGYIERHYRDLGNIYSKIGNHEKASECYKKAYEYSQQYKK